MTTAADTPWTEAVEGVLYLAAVAWVMATAVAAATEALSATAKNMAAVAMVVAMVVAAAAKVVAAEALALVAVA